MQTFDYNEYRKNNPLLKEESDINEREQYSNIGNPKFSSKNKAIQRGSPLDGGTDSEGVAYDPYKLEFDVDTCRIIQGRNVIEISRKASKELAKEIRNSFF
jgi:hypothetical protein